MWEIERRSSSATAWATARAGATVRQLADRVGLDAGEWREWLRPDGGVVPVGVDDPVAEEAAFRIPNTVYLLWLGDLWGLGRWLVGWHRNADYLRRRGYHVVAEVYEGKRVEKATEEAIQHRFAELSEAGALYGFHLTAHGWDWGFALAAGFSTGFRPPDFAIAYHMLEKRLRYRLGLAILNTCQGGWSREDLRPDGTRVDAGGRDLVSRSPGAKFHGVRRMLIPQILFWQADTKHFWNRLGGYEAPGERAPLAASFASLLERSQGVFGGALGRVKAAGRGVLQRLPVVLRPRPA